MLLAIAVTAAGSSLAASLYGQGKLSIDDAWLLVPPLLAPASAVTGAQNRMLQGELLRLKEELKEMQGAVERGQNKGRADSIESGEEEAVVSSLQRQLSASVSQLEATRKQLEQLESNHKELDSSKRKLEGELQARDAELISLRRESDAFLKEQLKAEVARARDETEAKIRHEHLSSVHKTVEQRYTKLEHDLSEARRDLQSKEADVGALRSEIVSIRRALTDGSDLSQDSAVAFVGGGEVSLAKAMRAEMVKLAAELKTTRADLATEREKRAFEEGMRKKADDEAAASKEEARADQVAKRELEAKLSRELEAKVDAITHAAETLQEREKSLVKECDGRLAQVREAAAEVAEASKSTCDARISSAESAAATAAELACADRVRGAQAECEESWGVKIRAAVDEASAIAQEKCAAESVQMQSEHAGCAAQLADCTASAAAQFGELQTCRVTDLASCKEELTALNETLAIVENRAEQALARQRKAEDEVRDAQLGLAAAEARHMQAKAELQTSLSTDQEAGMKELSPDSLKLNSDIQEEEGSCGLTPESCDKGAHNASVGLDAGALSEGGASHGGTGEVVIMAGAEFEAHLQRQTRTGGVTFVKFFAPWCGHCKRLAPTWEQLSAHFQDRPNVTIAKVDCTQAQDLCKGLGVEGLPTLALFLKGQRLDYTGKKDLASLVGFVASQIGDLTASRLEAVADARADDDAESQSCGLTPGSCAGEEGDGAQTSSVEQRSPAKGELSEDEIAAFYEKINKTDKTPTVAADPANKNGSPTSSPPGTSMESSVAFDQEGVGTASATTAAAKASATAEVDPDVARKAAEAQRRWDEALKNDPKRAEQMEYRARRAAGPALAGSDEANVGTAAEDKFCQGIAGEHAIFDGKQGGCRCKQGYTEDDVGKCVAETISTGKQNQLEAPSESPRAASAPTAGSTTVAAGIQNAADPDVARKAAEAQRRWDEALKNDPKRAEQMEYRARRAAGPALAGSDEANVGTAAEDKFCQGIAGEHAIFDGKQGGCRCKQGYTEDDVGKCVAEAGSSDDLGDLSDGQGGLSDDEGLGGLSGGEAAESLLGGFADGMSDEESLGGFGVSDEVGGLGEGLGELGGGLGEIGQGEDDEADFSPEGLGGF